MPIRKTETRPKQTIAIPNIQELPPPPSSSTIPVIIIKKFIEALMNRLFADKQMLTLTVLFGVVIY